MRRKFSRLTLEQLERREMFAGDVRPTLALPTADEFVGPLPLEPRKVAPAAEVAPPPAIEKGMSADEYFERFGNGNITAEVRDGRLIIRGDARDNVFTLYRYHDYATGEQAVALSAGWWSMVNGEFLRGTYNLMERYPHFNGVTAIDIDLGDGNDFVRIHAIEVPSLTIRTGAGDDQITLLGPTPMSLFVTGVYNPYPTLSGPTVDWNAPAEPLLIDGDLFIDTGAGNDQFTPFASVSGDATVQMGTGDDSYIEAPHAIQELYELPVVIDDIQWQLALRRVIGKLTAAGTIMIDLGPDQAVEDIPADWRSDIDLVGKMYYVSRVLDFYRGMIERGEDTPGTAQLITAPGEVPARVDAEGRLEIDFSFTAGYARVIERLQDRGVVLEAYSINRGVGRALVREADLKLFANLPGLGYFHARSYLSLGSIGNYQSDPEWDYVRPGSTTAAEVVDLPPRPEPPPPIKIITPVVIFTPRPIGPARLEEIRGSDAGPGSLLDSYYRARNMFTSVAPH